MMRACWAAVVCLLGAATASAQPPQVDVRPSRVEFGEVVVGTSERARVEIHNTGGLPLTVARLTVTAGFSVDAQGPFTFPPGAFWGVTVTFTPRTAGRIDGTLVVETNDPARSRVDVPLTGTGVSVTIRPRLDIRVQISPDPIRLAPDEEMPVTYRLREAAGVETLIRSAEAYVLFDDGRRIDLAARVFERRLTPGEVLAVEGSVVLPRAALDRAGTGARFVRIFVASGDNTQERFDAVARLEPLSSLAADFAVTGIAIESPRPSTIVDAGATLRASAILVGWGDGPVSGAWLVDGLAVERFVADLTGGRTRTVETVGSLPTAIVGTHELVLEIQSPTRLRSPAVRYLVGSRSAWRLKGRVEGGALSWTGPEGDAVFALSVIDAAGDLVYRRLTTQRSLAVNDVIAVLPRRIRQDRGRRLRWTVAVLNEQGVEIGTSELLPFPRRGVR